LLVQERNSANTPTVTYTRGRDLSGSLAGAGGIGGLLARSHGYSGGNWSSHHAYHADGNGNVTALADSAGALQASYRYDPYGRYLAGGGTLASANVLRFSSKPWVGFAGSATSGLYYYGYRFYDPYLQRWVNRDPIMKITNRLDGLGRTKYVYAVLGNGQRTFTEDGPWASDEVTVTNRYGRRAGLRLAQPSGDFAVKPTSVFPMR
jgi:RHS repeat-associated protein